MGKKINIKASTIDVNDILTVMSQHNFSSQKQIEVLHIFSFALHIKQYPEDILGIIDKKIKLLEQAEQETSTPANSNLQLSTKKGSKVNFIRVINSLCELSFFTDKNGNNITKKEVFDVFGKIINQDLSTFHNDLSANKAAANSDMKNTLVIFEQMKAKQQEINQK